MTDIHDVTSQGYQVDFEEIQKAPTNCVPMPLKSWNSVSRDSGGGIGIPFEGWVITVGGASGGGKSLFALNVLAHVLTNSKIPVAMVSLEMSHRQVATRFYSIASGVPIRNIEPGNFKNTEWNKVREFTEELPSFYVPTKGLSSVDDVLRYCNECYQRGVRVFVVDYLQLIGHSEKSILEGTINVMVALRKWAVDNLAIVINLSQLNRRTTSEKERPHMSALLGSSILEQASDQVLILDHTRFKKEPSGMGAMGWCCILKNRHGPVTDIPIRYDFSCLRISQGQPHELSRWPGGNSYE